MSAPVKTWLKHHLTRLDSVRTCAIDREAHLVVYYWSGVISYIHLLNAPEKTRSLKRLVQEATRIGVGSLFMLDAKLVPPQGKRLVPDEWMVAIHALTDERIYTYRADPDGIHIGQMHFTPIARGDEIEVVYGPEVNITNTPFFRIWIKTNPLKGDWLVTTFGTDTFWKPAGEPSVRFYQYWGYRHANGSNATNGAASTQTKLDNSYAFLGLKQGASCEEVKTAFRKLAREVHPDVSQLPKAEAEAKFKALSEAYNFIKDNSECGQK